MKKNITVILVTILMFLASGCKTTTNKSLLQKDASKYQKLGREAQEKNDLDNAISYYKKAVYIDPYNAKMLNDLGVIYEQRQMYKDAETTYLKATEVDKAFLAAYFNLGRLYEKVNNINKAIEYYKLRVKLSQDPNDPWVWKAKHKIQYYEKENYEDIKD